MYSFDIHFNRVVIFYVTVNLSECVCMYVFLMYDSVFNYSADVSSIKWLSPPLFIHWKLLAGVSFIDDILIKVVMEDDSVVSDVRVYLFNIIEQFMYLGM